MSETIRPFDDDEAAIEYAMLWDDLNTTLRAHAFDAGIIDPDYVAETHPDRQAMVSYILQSEVFPLATLNGNLPTTAVLLPDVPRWFTAQLWGGPDTENLIGHISLTYLSAENGEEVFSYHMNHRQIDFYGNQESLAVTDAEAIEGLRNRVRTLRWDPNASARAAEQISGG